MSCDFRLLDYLLLFILFIVLCQRGKRGRCVDVKPIEEFGLTCSFLSFQVRYRVSGGKSEGRKGRQW